MAGRGRGRGATLPAWMTANDAADGAQAPTSLDGSMGVSTTHNFHACLILHSSLFFSSLLFSFLFFSSLLLYSFILSFLYCSFSFINSHNRSWASLPLSNRKISHLSLLLLVGFICPTHIKILNESNPVNPLKMPQTRHQSQWTGRQ